MHHSDSNTESDADTRKRASSPAPKKVSRTGSNRKRKKKTASSDSDDSEPGDLNPHRHVIGDPTYTTEEEKCAFNPSTPGSSAWFHLTRHVSSCFNECINDRVPLCDQKESMARFVHLYLLHM